MTIIIVIPQYEYDIVVIARVEAKSSINVKE